MSGTYTNKTPYEPFLHLVNKPARYISIEKNVIRKNLDEVAVSILLCFPEVYELGMSHLGLKILYHLLNEKDYIAAERCFAPWGDMEQQLRQRKQSLLSMETGTPLNKFSFVGFSLQSELTFTNMLNVLDLSGIPLFSKERSEDDPIVLAGGPVTSNPEPCADFVDAFLIGDGEEAFLELAEYYRLAKEKGLSRERILVGIANIPGWYVPKFYQEKFDNKGVYEGVERVTDEVPEQVVRRWVEELKVEYYPTNPVIPQTAAIQDRHVVEVVRGCTQSCRFCQAGYIYRPIRELPTEAIVELTEEGLKETGYEEVGLVSLSTADYSDVGNMVREVSKVTTPKHVAISLPSLRADRMSVEVADSVRQIKHSGFTFAPEAGSVRLRRVINKNITNEELLAAVKMAFDKGWSVIKLYFMVGLPSETYEDLDETIELIQTIEKIAKDCGGRKRVNVSFGPFVPKAHTPFQWDAFMGVKEIGDRMQYVRERVSSRIVHFKFQPAYLSHFEAVISKGNRSVAKGLYQAFLDGHRFEGWSETFDYKGIMNSLRVGGVDIDYWTSEKDIKQALPWDHIDVKIKKKYLTFERKKAFRDHKQTTTDCRWGDCHYCGIPTPKDDIRLKHEPPSPEELLRRRDEWSKDGSKVFRMEQTRADATRYRLVYTKANVARFLAHSDMIRLFQLGIKSCDFPVLLSKGFNPRPVMQFGPVLPLGISSRSELLDLWLIDKIDQSNIDALNNYLPDGVEVLSFEALEPSKKSLSSLFPLARYEMDVNKLDDNFRRALDNFNSEKSFIVQHRDKEIDLSRAVRFAHLEDGRLRLDLSVCSQKGANANPFLVLEKVFGYEKDLWGNFFIEKVAVMAENI